MAHIGENMASGAGDHLTIHVQRAANLGELEGDQTKWCRPVGIRNFSKKP